MIDLALAVSLAVTAWVALMVILQTKVGRGVWAPYQYGLLVLFVLDATIWWAR